jgi:hypothetical protein
MEKRDFYSFLSTTCEDEVAIIDDLRKYQP